MRPSLLAPTFLLASLAVTAACGTGGTGGSSSSSSSSTASSSTGGGSGGLGGAAPGSLAGDYCAPLAALICKRAAACGCGVIVPSGTLDEAACTTQWTQKCLDAYAPLADAITAGKGHVVADAAHACVAQIEAATPGCERPRGSVSQGLCPAWFTSDAPLGAACEFPICAGAAGVCTNGVCVARPGAGEPCPAELCAPGLLCLGGSCVAPAAEGKPCMEDVACNPPLRCVNGSCAPLAAAPGACTDEGACALGLVCTAGACAERPAGGCGLTDPCGHLALCAAKRACAPKGTSGAPCTADDACAEGHYCDTAAGACAAAPGLGMPCANGVFCAVGLACDGDLGNCAALPGDGDPCAFGPAGPFICQDGLGCNAGTCGALPGDGAPCTIDSRCASGLGCDFGAQGSLCVPLRDAGGACQTDRTCKPGLYCDYTVNACAPVLPGGAPCAAGNECGPAGSCLPGPGGALSCAPLPGLGEYCLFDCASGLTCVTDEAASSCVAEICKEL